MAQFSSQEKKILAASVQAAVTRGLPFTAKDLLEALGEVAPLTYLAKASVSEIDSYLYESFYLGEMPGWAHTRVTVEEKNRTPRHHYSVYFKLTPNMAVSKTIKRNP